MEFFQTGPHTVAEHNNIAFHGDFMFGSDKSRLQWSADERGLTLGTTQILAGTGTSVHPKILPQIAAFCNQAHRLYIDPRNDLCPQLFLTVDKTEIHKASNSSTVVTIDVTHPDHKNIVRFHVRLSVPHDGDDVYCSVVSPRVMKDSVSKEVKGLWIPPSYE